MIYGGLANDTIDGGSEADTLYGDEGNDILNGGQAPTASSVARTGICSPSRTVTSGSGIRSMAAVRAMTSTFST
ncbi:hypothetical protein [Tabrizicola sp.]|uniref:hypothetical protein n=1 Tax=Tabrizicola sp. TaxID=2005166 RepID=UPI001A4CBFF0|nr:hypothetical protein [Tabrizicola sp.]